MKKYQKVNSGFRRLTDENLLVLSETVLGALAENHYFPEPNPPLSEIQPAIEEYTEKLAIARRRGSPQDTAEKNESRLIVEKHLRELAFYVNTIARGNLAVMLSSGFEISRYRRSVLPPEKIKNIRMTDGANSGQIRLSFDAQPRVRLYEYRYTADKDLNGKEVWNNKVIRTSTSRNNLIDSLMPGRYYYVSVRAINSRGIGDWSEIATWMAR